MKKFFSLVLALVMALSLTTVAWGADPVVATVGSDEYTDLQAAIQAAAPSGTVEIVDDVTVAEWKMFAETMTHADIITCNINGLTINGNGHKLTVNSIVSGGNGNRLFYDAENLNIYDLTIVAPNGLGLKSGVISGVTFDTAGYGVLPGTGAVTIEDCTFKTDSTAIYYEDARDDLTVTGNTFELGADTNVIILRGATTFTGNTVTSGRTVNVVSDTATVSGNNFVDTRVKLYNEGQELSGNSFGEDAYIELDTGVTSADVSGNYWGGSAPTAAQLGGATATTYYSEPDMTGITGTASAPASAVKGAYLTANMGNLSVYPGLDLDTYTYSLEHYVNGNAVAKTFDQKALWKTHKLTGAKTIEEVFVVAASAESADYAFVNGSQITYLNDVAGYTGTVFALPTVEEDDAEKCGDMFVGGDYAAYTDANEKLYVEKAGGTVYNVDGKYVELVPAVVATPVVGDLKTLNPAAYTLYIVAHTYDYDAKTVKGDKTVTAVFCEECKANFAFVEGTKADAVKKFGAGNYNDLSALVPGLYVAKTASSASAGTSTDKVTSAETFDAGIAMYVGMSVMAAAGSVVVLKKRED
ncbi:MAG: hypothetical protein J6J01_05820 [Oscillospiraceae bacterium]|nr:hypothetical protein [Oscillospiraceae bacterium]